MGQGDPDDGYQGRLRLRHKKRFQGNTSEQREALFPLRWFAHSFLPTWHPCMFARHWAMFC